MRVADLIAYVNHDIDDAIRAEILRAEDLPAAAIDALGRSSSARIGTLVKDVVTETLSGEPSGNPHERSVLEALLSLRSFLFDAVYENSTATAEFRKASDILSGLWEKVRERPSEFLDPRTDRHRGSRCRDARLHCGHDGSLRRPALRAALHSETLVH